MVIFHSYVNLPEGTWPVKSHSSCHFGEVGRWVATCFHSTNLICRLRSPCSLAFPKHIPSKYPGALGATGQPTLWPLGWPPNHDGSCFSMIFHGKRWHNYGTSPFFLATSTVSMVMFAMLFFSGGYSIVKYDQIELHNVKHIPILSDHQSDYLLMWWGMVGKMNRSFNWLPFSEFCGSRPSSLSKTWAKSSKPLWIQWFIIIFSGF